MLHPINLRSITQTSTCSASYICSGSPIPSTTTPKPTIRSRIQIPLWAPTRSRRNTEVHLGKDAKKRQPSHDQTKLPQEPSQHEAQVGRERTLDPAQTEWDHHVQAGRA